MEVQILKLCNLSETLCASHSTAQHITAHIQFETNGHKLSHTLEHWKLKPAPFLINGL